MSDHQPYDEKAALARTFPEAVHQPSLSQAINAATKDLHDVVNQLIMSRLALGLRDYHLYREGILTFFYVYRTFEDVWAELLTKPSSMPPHIHAALSAIADPRISRAGALAADLEYFFDHDFDPEGAPMTAGRRGVVDHITAVCTEKPHVLLAYAHSYYMALFAGGKVIARQVLNTKDFFPVHAPASTEDEAKLVATNMFIFPVEKGKEEELRKKFKDGMAAAEETLSEEEKTDIIAESRTIFQWNEKLIRELDDVCAKIAPLSPPPYPEHEVVPRLTLRERAVQYKFPFIFLALVAFWALRHLL